jgi:hypothetical protein
VTKVSRETDPTTTRLGVRLLNRIISATACSPGRGGSVAFKPLAKWFFDDIRKKEGENITEQDFVLALTYIRKRHPAFYSRIDIPKKWDGGAHLEFPELFFTEETIRVRALQDIPALGDLGPYDKGDEFDLPGDATYLIRRKMVEPCTFEGH